ncbi:hypothetical protein [Aurantiacibacter poecillastricola]|uniref:hypothetical protein n=1 Tax=Aurantiacibacter poecillastricola TaxID=3064385 RepID=UPI00273DF1D9|nr:hypothetical protein [Aurantiacibacter sp. 219JJ12-13]MDP5262937.1 hypothetical protein [Aurantiacibacter sp. 219JJ12-13]
MKRFRQFVAIDWSGAVGERHKGIVVAACSSEGPPTLPEPPGRGWSRHDVLDFLTSGLSGDTLVGLDLGIALPFADQGAYFPGWEESPPDAPSLWAMIDHLSQGDEHLAATSFVDHPRASDYFRRHGGREGENFAPPGLSGGRGRFRITEEEQARMGCKPYSNFNLVGAAQVGKSSLTGMRMLHRLRGTIPVWPVDPLPASGPVLVEIYTTLAAIAAGRTASRAKMRSFEAMNEALETLGSPPVAGEGPIDDHTSDAMVTAAWLRTIANRSELWSPNAMTPAIARTEGWTFGVP